MEMRKRGSALMGKGGMTMTEREKVIKRLEKCRRCECDDCTEKDASKAPWDCPAYDDFVDSAIALLKEQEAEVEWCARCGRVRLKSKWERSVE